MWKSPGDAVAHFRLACSPAHATYGLRRGICASKTGLRPTRYTAAGSTEARERDRRRLIHRSAAPMARAAPAQ